MRNGSTPTPDVVILRYVAFLLTILIPFGLLISFALVLTDPERRTLHDRIAKTIVLVVVDLTRDGAGEESGAVQEMSAVTGQETADRRWWVYNPEGLIPQLRSSNALLSR